MDAVLVSINPKWCKLITSGEKSIEVRKTRPRKTPFKAYMYETRGFQKVGNDNLNCTVGGNGRGAVIGEFVCEYTQEIYFDADVRYGIDHPNDYGNWLMEVSRVTLWEMHDYFAGKDGVYWNISKPIIYDTPKPLSDFRRPCQNSFWCESCAMWSEHRGCGNAALQVKRPPQSWMYVKEESGMSDCKRTCADCRYFDEDESWSEDDYFYFNFCDIGARDGDEITPDTEACAAFTPIKQIEE